MNGVFMEFDSVAQLDSATPSEGVGRRFESGRNRQSAPPWVLRRKEAMSKALGMPRGTAENRLRKAIMFSLVQQAGRDVCYHCNCRIDTVSEFSIEHKEPWENSPRAETLFFSLENIAFSHLVCNVKASRRRPRKHASESAKTAAYQRTPKGRETRRRENEKRRAKRQAARLGEVTCRGQAQP